MLNYISLFTLLFPKVQKHALYIYLDQSSFHKYIENKNMSISTTCN